MNINANGPEGNAFAIMGTVRSLLKQVGRSAEWPDIQVRMIAGDYNNLCDEAEAATHGVICVTGR